MVRTYSAALAAGGRLGKAAVVFVGMVLAVGAIVPLPEPSGPMRSEPVDSTGNENRVVLAVPEGGIASTLTVVDASGREIATLTRWYNGDTVMMARQKGGAGVNCLLNARGSAELGVFGMTQHTRIEVQPDGTTKIHHPVPRRSVLRQDDGPSP
jgi:hypothetical protein